MWSCDSVTVLLLKVIENISLLAILLSRVSSLFIQGSRGVQLSGIKFFNQSQFVVIFYGRPSVQAVFST